MRSISKPSLTLGSFSVHRRIILPAILLLAFALRVARLNFQPLWWDEGYSVYFATRDLGTLLDLTALDIHPPLYYVLLQFWTIFAGTGDYAIRILSVAFGVLTIPFIYALAQRLTAPTPNPSPVERGRGEGVGAVAAFLFALAPIEVYYSQEVRMYGLVTLLCLASTYCFVRLLALPVGQLSAALVAVIYILFSAAAMYTQYYAAFIIAFQFLYVIIMFLRRSPRPPQDSLPHWLGTFVAIGILYLPWLIYAGGKLYSYVTFKVGHEAYPAQDPVAFFAQHLAAFALGHISSFSWLPWTSGLFIALALYGIVRKHKSWLASNLLIGLYLLLPLTLGYLVSLRYPFHPIRYERLLLLASPAFFLLVAHGLATVKWRPLAVSALFILSILSLLSLFDFYTVKRYPDDDYRPLIREIQSLAQRGDNFLAIYPWQIGYLESYYHGAPLNIIETPNDAWTQNPTQMQADLKAFLAENNRVWVPALQTLGRIVEDAVDAELRPKNYSVVDTWFGTTRLELFLAAEDPPPARTALQLDGAELSNWGVSGNSVVSGQDAVRVWLDGGSAPQSKVSVRLVDASGNIWAQDDRDIEHGIQRIALAIPIGTPPGMYDLRLALYRGNDLGSEAISIASIEVAPNEQPNLSAVPHRVQVEFANGMNLIGWDADDSPLKPGNAAGVTLFWQSPQKQSAEYLVAVQLQGAFGKVYLDASDAIARGLYGATRWRSNELVRDPRTFTVPGDIPDGTYTLALSLVDPITQQRVKTRDGHESVELGPMPVKGRPHYFGAPSVSQKSGARVGEIAKLVGYDVDRSGRDLQVILYWQALARSELSYQVFVHVVDSNGKIIVQKDRPPGNGEFPTTTWVKGEYLADVYMLTLPEGISDYQIRVGMYDPGSGVRLPTFDAEGHSTEGFLTLK